MDNFVYGWTTTENSEIFEIRLNNIPIDGIVFDRHGKSNLSDVITGAKCQDLCECYGLNYDPYECEEWGEQ